MPISPVVLSIMRVELASLLLGLILSFDVIWRTQGRLDIFAKLIAAALTARLAERLIILLRFDSPDWGTLWINLLFDAFLVGAIAELYRLIRSLDGETKK